MSGVANLNELLVILCAQGVRPACVKHLSVRQDNEKNQIFWRSNTICRLIGKLAIADIHCHPKIG